MKFSDSIVTVDEFAFADCNELKSVRLPKSLVNIGTYAFGHYFDGNQYSEEEGNENDGMIIIDGFKIYADKDSTAEKYAKACGIEVVTGTMAIMGKNVSSGFVYTCIGAVGAVVLGGLTALGIKASKKKKKSSGKKKSS